MGRVGTRWDIVGRHRVGEDLTPSGRCPSTSARRAGRFGRPRPAEVLFERILRVPLAAEEEAVPDDATTGWALVRPHLAYQDPVAAIAWLSEAFGFQERVHMDDEDGGFITAKLQTPAGGLVMVTGYSDDWLRQQLPGLPRQEKPPYPHRGHTISVMVPDVDAHFQQAKAGGATILHEPAD